MLEIKEKTGFKTKSPFLFICEDDMPFYVRVIDEKGLRFNLPAGNYDVKVGEFEQCEPVDYPLIKIDEPYNFTPFPKALQLVYRPTPAKCQIDTDNGIVYADPMFKKFPKYTWKWVYGHELGHFPYQGKGIKSEKDCDIFSANLLLMEGFNPSQIRSAIDLVLSNRLSSLCRKYNVLDNLVIIESWMK